jgi:hypothetical protein
MKKKTWMLGLAIALGLSLTSCSQESNLAESKQGRLFLNLKSETGFSKTTRALNEKSYANTDNYQIVVTDKNNNVKLNCKGSDLQNFTGITLPLGGFKVQAFYGEEHAYSRDAFYVYGETVGNISADDMQTVTVTCTPTCGRIAVNFAPEMATYYQGYNVTFTGTEAMGTNVISWLENDTEPWYVKLNEGGETISFTITTTTKSEYVDGNKNSVTTKTGTFKLDRNKAYKMNISPTYTPTTEGQLDINVTIDESTNDSEHDIEIDVDWI